jgi:trimethylamine--corrinoid protein Co-methyltransferase
MHVVGHAFQVLSGAEIDLIHQSALTILAKMGMEIENRQLLEALDARGIDVDYDAQRAFFSSDFVERFIADAPKVDWMDPGYRVHGSAGVYEGLYHDPISDDLVPWTEERLVLYFALARTLNKVTGASMLGCPLQVPAPLVPLYERYYCWKYGASEAGTILNDEICPYLLTLYEAAAADQNKELSEVFTGAVYLIPSLKLGRHEAYQVTYFRERGLEVRIGHSMMTMGATAPVTLAGAVTLNLAEQLALSILDWALFDKRCLHLSCSLAPMDMRTAIRPFGRPEMAIANVMTAQLARYYGAPFSGHAGLTDAKRPTVEVGVQKTLSAVPTLLVGGSFWMDVGLLAIDQVYSPIQMVLDNEFLGALNRFVYEYRIDEDTIGLETILKAGPGGQYLNCIHTAQNFRYEIWNPAIWSREMLQAWIADGAELDVDKARDFVRRVQREIDREPVQMISPSLERDVLNLIERARQSLV